MTIPGTIRRNKRTTLYEFAAPLPGTQRVRWINTGQSRLSIAKRIVAHTGVDRLAYLAAARQLTEATMAAVTSGHTTFDEAIPQWLDWLRSKRAANTVDSYASSLARLIHHTRAAEQPLTWITERQIDNFVNCERVKITTRQARHAAVLNFYRWANAKGFLGDNPAELVEINHRDLGLEHFETTHHEAISDEDYLQLIGSHKVLPFWHDAFVLGYCAGYRFIDVCQFEWASVQTGALVIYPLKTRQNTAHRLVLRSDDGLVFRPELRELVDRLQTAPREDEKWVWPRAAHAYLDRIGRRKLVHESISQMQLAGVKGPTFHCLRSGFARRLYDAGRSLRDVAAAMGHGSTDTTRGYLGLAPAARDADWPLNRTGFGPASKPAALPAAGTDSAESSAASSAPVVRFPDGSAQLTG